MFSTLSHLSLNSSKGSVLLFSLKRQPDRKKKNRENQGIGVGKLIPADTSGAHVECIEADLLFCMAGSLKKLPQISTPSRPMSDPLPCPIPPVLCSRLCGWLRIATRGESYLFQNGVLSQQIQVRIHVLLSPFLSSILNIKSIIKFSWLCLLNIFWSFSWFQSSNSFFLITALAP